jgi:hypothetical protein
VVPSSVHAHRTDAGDQGDGFLGAHGYTVAPFTIETVDYAFAPIYERAMMANDEASGEEVMAAYLTTSDERMAFAECWPRTPSGATFRRCC